MRLSGDVKWKRQPEIHCLKHLDVQTQVGFVLNGEQKERDKKTESKKKVKDR